MNLYKFTTVIIFTTLLACCSDEDGSSANCEETSEEKIEASFFLIATDTWTTNENVALVDHSASSGCRTKSSSKVSDGAAMPESAVSAMSDDSSAGADFDSGEAGGDSPGGDSSIEGGTQGSAGILTAGTFDDTVNPDAFRNFWDGDKEDQSQGFDTQDTSAYKWPAFADVDIAERFGGSAKTKLELAIVVDATGSMSDELTYLQAEIEDISNQIKSAKPDVDQQFSMIVYRDRGDAYETRGVEFTGELARFQKFLNEQSAAGGGDYPEAMHTALAEATEKLQWGSDDAAKVLFLIADAPPHDSAIGATVDAIAKLKEQGVRVYPVAASGVAALAEKVMRFGAATTGGEYIFITDDSGVGNPHAEPHIPCYHVRALNKIMVDTVIAEIEQSRKAVATEDIIRSVGKESDGVCQPAAADNLEETPSEIDD